MRKDTLEFKLKKYYNKKKSLERIIRIYFRFHENLAFPVATRNTLGFVALSSLADKREKKIPRAQGLTDEKEKEGGEKCQASAKCIVRNPASQREYLALHRATLSESAIHGTILVQKKEVYCTPRSPALSLR